MQVNVHEAKTHFSRLIARALAGEEVIVAKNGRPLVRLSAIAAPEGERTPGLSMGAATIHDDFDDPLPDDVLQGFET